MNETGHPQRDNHETISKSFQLQIPVVKTMDFGGGAAAATASSSSSMLHDELIASKVMQDNKLDVDDTNDLLHQEQKQKRQHQQEQQQQEEQQQQQQQQHQQQRQELEQRQKVKNDAKSLSSSTSYSTNVTAATASSSSLLHDDLLASKARQDNPLDTNSLRALREHQQQRTEQKDNQQQIPEAIGEEIHQQTLSYQCKAPSDMPGDYQFLVDINGHATLVRVPSGGVKAGETFLATIVDSLAEQSITTGTTPITFADGSLQGYHDKDQTFDVTQNIPHGHWRTDICDCCDQKGCHASCCLAYWCMPCALGQVMTRMNLDALGQKRRRNASDSGGSSTELPYWTTFKIISLLWIAFLLLHIIITSMVAPYYDLVLEADGTPSYFVSPTWAEAIYFLRMAMGFAWALWMLIILILARQAIRQRYDIRGGGCEDCCFSFWCSCCTVTQMLQHTADYDNYNAACCSDTGLPENAGIIV